MHVRITTWKIIRNEVINLHAAQSQNSSELTGNISKNTSRFTSKTDQIRLVGGPWGGLPLYKSLLPDCMRREARAVGVCGETYETYETHETYETMMRLGGK